MNKVTLPPMPLAHAEVIRKIAQAHGALVTYIYNIKQYPFRVVVEIEKRDTK